MKYMIAYMIRGEAGEYLLALGNRLAEEFKLAPISVRIDPHLTLKAPFECPQLLSNSPRTTTPCVVVRGSREPEDSRIREIENIVEAFARGETPRPMRLEGFAHLKGKVVHMVVHAGGGTHLMIRRLQDQLRGVSWLDFKRTEFPLTLHASVCYPKSPEHAKEILHALRREHTAFDFSIDSIAILCRKERWEMWREFPLRALRN